MPPPPRCRAIVTPLLRNRSNEEQRAQLARRTDEELVQDSVLAREGDTRAFDELVRRYEAMVRANCRYLTRAEDDTWDLAQEVLVKAYYALDRFEERAQFRTWLWRIKANHCLNYLDRQRVRAREQMLPVTAPVIRDQPSSAPSPERLAESSETVARVRAVLDQLPDSSRIPLVLRDLDGLSYPEISEQLDIGVSAAKMRVSRARAEFREVYGDPATGG